MITITVISFAIVTGTVIFVLTRALGEKGTSFRSAILFLMAGVFAGLLILDLPLALSYYREAYPSENVSGIFFVSLMQSIQNTLRTFVLDGSWSELVRSEEGVVRIPAIMTVQGMLLSVMAPLLTFSAFLSFFKNFISKKLLGCMVLFRRPLIIFSELNKDTILLAEDIRDYYRKQNRKVFLVYTDVFPEDEENNFELREQAGRLHSLMLMTDIAELNIGRRRGLTEYFLLGHDEEENVMQARKLFNSNKGASNTDIYVKATEKGNAFILDSLTASLRMEDLGRNAASESTGYEALKKHVRSGGVIRLRMIDPEKQVAWREIPDMEFVKKAHALPADGEQRTLSVLVFADTHLSFTIIKTLLWYCQSEKFRLELNIVYADNVSSQDVILSGMSGDMVNVRSLLEFECPEIISTNNIETEGDSFYSIEFIENSRFESGNFQSQLIRTAVGDDSGSELIGRLLRTDAAIVDRGNDGATLETAAFLRNAFERVKIEPEIYAVCADESDIFTDLNEQRNILTYDDRNYNIRFIGRRCDIYTYDKIRNLEEEDLAFSQHVKWIDVDHKDDPAEVRDGMLKDELLKYERHDYYRNSSIVKAMYLRNVFADPDKRAAEENVIRDGADAVPDENTRFEKRIILRPEYECLNNPAEPRGRWTCHCENCMRRRRQEHNRWNAYMRTEGFITSPEGIVNDKRPLARVHGNITPFDRLDETARIKDS